MTSFQTILFVSTFSVAGAMLSACSSPAFTPKPKPIDTSNTISTTQNLDEPFETFYNRFKNDSQFKFDRTVFPIKATLFHMNTLDEQDVSVVQTWNLEDIKNGTKYLFVNENIVRSEGYSHQIKKQRNGTYKVEIGKINSEPACGYIFRQKNGNWYLVEFMNYWGGNTQH